MKKNRSIRALLIMVAGAAGALISLNYELGGLMAVAHTLMFIFGLHRFIFSIL